MSTQLTAPRPVLLAEARLAGLKARHPEATDELIASFAGALRMAGAHGDQASLDAVATLAASTSLREAFVWDVKRNAADWNSELVNSYPRDVDRQVRTALESSGADFPNSYLTADGDLAVKTYLAGTILVRATREGRLMVHRDGQWISANEGQSDNALWNETVHRLIDYRAIERTFGVLGLRGEVSGHIDTRSGHGFFTWTHGECSVAFSSSDAEQLTIDPLVSSDDMAAFIEDFRQSKVLDPSALIEKNAVQARQKMIWHPDADHSRYQFRDGAIRDMHEAMRYKSQTLSSIRAQLPGAVVHVRRGSTRVYHSTNEWSGEARLDYLGTEKLIIDGHESEDLSQCLALRKVVDSHRGTLLHLAIASHRGIEA